MFRPLLLMAVAIPLILMFADYGLHCSVANTGKVTSDQLSLYRLSNIEIHDADTLLADIHLGFNVVLTHQTIRIKDFDAWEVSTSRRTVKVTKEEIVKGLQARDYVINMLKNTAFKVSDGKYDIYNRVVADVYWLDTKQNPMEYKLLRDTLRKEGFERNGDPQTEN